jgi:adenylyltransferase/sulfurtransferase
VEPAADLSIDEVRRYSRHLIIPDVGMDGQKRLKNAKVLAVGAGGLGSPVLMYLAAAGVGTLGIVEFDTVDESNLQRRSSTGSPTSAGPRPRAPGTRSGDQPARRRPPARDAAGQRQRDGDLQQYDLIVDGTDNFATRYLVNDACVLLGKPYVWGSIYRFDGRSRSSGTSTAQLPRPLPGAAAARDGPLLRRGRRAGVLCATIGAIQATEAVKLITGIGETLLGRLMVYDALEMTFRTIKVRKDPEAEPITGLIDYEAFCGVVSDEAQEAAAGSTITVDELKDMMDAGQGLRAHRRPRAQRVRDRVHPGATLIPKDEILSGRALSQLPQDRPIVLHCKTGVRSAEALAAVKNAGFKDAVHVQGGVTAWATRIDKTLPTY